MDRIGVIGRHFQFSLGEEAEEVPEDKQKASNFRRRDLPYTPRKDLSLRMFMLFKGKKISFNKEAVWKFIRKRKRFILKKQQELKDEMEADEKGEDVEFADEHEIELAKNDEYDARFLAQDELDKDDDRFSVLVKKHNKQPPTELAPLCAFCHQKKAFYFTKCKHWFVICAECFKEEYANRYLPSRCPTCKKSIRSIYRLQEPVPQDVYHRALFYPSLTTLETDSAARHEEKRSIAAFYVTERNVQCAKENCNATGYYHPDCMHLDDFCKEHLPSNSFEMLLECNHADPETKDFLLGSRGPCEMPQCGKTAHFYFCCGHHSRYCAYHTGKNETLDTLNKPFNISRICHICQAQPIVYIPHPSLPPLDQF